MLGTEKIYQTVKIGDQFWFAENLNFETENSMCMHDSTHYCDKYGRLYYFEDALNVCPEGWHLPSDDEWHVLESFLSGVATEEYVAGEHTVAYDLKASTGWQDDGNGSNSSGFNALPGGELSTTYKIFNGLGQTAGFWTSTRFNDEDGNIKLRNIYSFHKYLSPGYGPGDNAYSVRCLKD